VKPRPRVADYEDEMKPILRGFDYDDEEKPRSNIVEKPNTKPFYDEETIKENVKPRPIVVD